MKKACPCLAAGKYFPSLYAARQNGYKNVIRLDQSCVIVVSTLQQKIWTIDYLQKMYPNLTRFYHDTFQTNSNYVIKVRTKFEMKSEHFSKRILPRYTMQKVIQVTEPWNRREYGR